MIAAETPSSAPPPPPQWRSHPYPAHGGHLLSIRRRPYRALAGAKHLPSRPAVAVHRYRMGDLRAVAQMAAADHHHRRHLHLLGLPAPYAVERRENRLRVIRTTAGGEPCSRDGCGALLSPGGFRLQRRRSVQRRRSMDGMRSAVSETDSQPSLRLLGERHEQLPRQTPAAVTTRWQVGGVAWPVEPLASRRCIAARSRNQSVARKAFGGARAGYYQLRPQHCSLRELQW